MRLSRGPRTTTVPAALSCRPAAVAVPDQRRDQQQEQQRRAAPPGAARRGRPSRRTTRSPRDDLAGRAAGQPGEHAAPRAAKTGSRPGRVAEQAVGDHGAGAASRSGRPTSRAPNPATEPRPGLGQAEPLAGVLAGSPARRRPRPPGPSQPRLRRRLPLDHPAYAYVERAAADAPGARNTRKHEGHRPGNRPALASRRRRQPAAGSRGGWMFSNADEVLRFIKDEDVKFVDVRFCDLPGIMQHFNVPAESVDEDFFINGQMFDGSSIRGFQAIHESDMKLIPDPATAYVDPFRAEKTLALNFSHRRPVHRRALQPRPAQHRGQGRGLPQGHRHRRHRVLRPRGGVLRLRRRALRDQAERRLLLHRLHRGRLEHRPRRGGRQPRLQDALQGRLLPGPAGRPLRRPARPDDPRARTRPASRSSARTTRSAPPARPRSTTSSTRCCTPATS